MEFQFNSKPLNNDVSALHNIGTWQQISAINILWLVIASLKLNKTLPKFHMKCSFEKLNILKKIVFWVNLCSDRISQILFLRLPRIKLEACLHKI